MVSGGFFSSRKCEGENEGGSRYIQELQVCMFNVKIL